MLTVGDIKKITNGKLLQGNASTAIKGVSIDSRRIQQKNVFVAIIGERFNGHDFIRTAIRKGAKALVVSKKLVCSEDIAVLRVKDTTKALGRIAAWHRSQFSIPVIAVTGSAGKTTTKELVASILATRFKVLKNFKTENNQYGVPLTLLKLNMSHQLVVIELGTNQPGDIRWLAQIVRPTTVIFTNIGDSHLARLRNKRGVFNEKVQLINYMEEKGEIILNGDDRYLLNISEKKARRKITRFGFGAKVDYKAHHVIVENNRRIHFQLRGRTFKINSPVKHNVYNALAAISCGLHHKIRYNDMDSAFQRFQFRNARQEVIKNGRFWLIDDTYNANPLSLNSALNTLDSLKIKGKKILVCADMLELGRQSKALHQSAGRMIAGSTVNAVVTIGHQAQYISQSLSRSDGNVNAFHYNNLKEVHRRLKSLYCPGDAVLVKGSRSMHMERTVNFLKTHFK